MFENRQNLRMWRVIHLRMVLQASAPAHDICTLARGEEIKQREIAPSVWKPTEMEWSIIARNVNSARIDALTRQ